MILREDADSVVLVYSSENTNYIQRKVSYQFNLVAETFKKESSVGEKIKFYSYDAYLHAFPKGIPYMSPPP